MQKKQLTIALPSAAGIAAFGIAAGLVIGCGLAEDSKSNQPAKEAKSNPTESTPPKETIIEGKNGEKIHKRESGLEYVEEKVGEGPAAKSGDVVSVHYTGTFKDTGKKFDSSFDHPAGEPIEFRLGRRGVIAGWDEGIAGMKVGGKRKLIIPSKLAYGPEGKPPVIPPDADLVFEVELMKIK